MGYYITMDNEETNYIYNTILYLVLSNKVINKVIK